MALVIWDHAVCLRERLLWSDTCEPGVPRLVKETLARLHHAAACVLYKTADLVVPCCATFNVGWEMWLGRPAEGILPVLNGLDVTKVSFAMAAAKACLLVEALGTTVPPCFHACLAKQSDCV